MDTSTISFAGYTFDADKGCFTCIHVIDGAPVLLFLHEGNGDLQFMCGVDDHDFEKDCQFVHATHILDEQPDLASLPNVELGHLAERIDAQSPWAVHPLPEDE
ncbi:hypothetical protein QP166_06470 [Sphingomonas sp. LR60]|uniref:hypothetical protein n=1 Tax=Sphingomonas sp. LR60 TaxID=3050233 RepID=UPI002FE36E46